MAKKILTCNRFYKCFLCLALNLFVGALDSIEVIVMVLFKI